MGKSRDGNGDKKKAVDPTFAQGEYGNVIDEIGEDGACPFCPETFNWHTEPILRRIDKWLITPSFKPYENAKYHFLIIGEEHKENFLELTLNDFESVQLLTYWAIRKFNLEGGGLTHRFGKTEFTGATVCHLHFHLIMPEKGKTVNFPIG